MGAIRWLELDSLDNTSIAAATLVGSYTCDADRMVFATLYAQGLAGGGDYVYYVTVTPSGLSEGEGLKTTQTLGATTYVLFAQTIGIALRNGDVMKVYLDGLAGDTTTPDMRVNFFEDGALAPTTAGYTLDVASTGEAGLDFNNIKAASGATTLTNITVPVVTTTGTATNVTTLNGIANDVITAASINTGALTADAFAANAIIAATLADDAITAAKINTGALTADAFAADAIVAATLATDAISADALAADAVTEIQSGLATPTNITAGTITTVTNLTNLPAMPTDWLTAAGLKTDAVTEIAAGILATALTESYAADGAAPTLTQAVLAIQQFLQERSITTTVMTVKKLDGSTSAMTFTLNDATSPTAITRAT